MEPLKKIELLAPARNPETAMAAVDWGADALYMGAPRFGARHAAGNSIEEVAKAADYAHLYGVRVYATLNTLLFENELAEAGRTAHELIAAGVDALIVQDMAYLEMGLRGVEFHASTQTFNASPERVHFLQAAGMSRVILERGLTLEQIVAIRAASDVELECFVHGAICVGYSGQCWLSRSMGPRSGNRGECSQPCRQTYDLTDASGNIILKNKYLLSVRDLDLSKRLGGLLDAGITSFKIEGRLKDVDYVKNTVGYYRTRLDREIAARPGLARASSGEPVMNVVPDLSKTFTRGRSEYFLDGKRRGVASFGTNKAVGELLGKVSSAGREWFELDGRTKLNPGDGICFFTGGELVGTNINKVEGRRIFPNKTPVPPAGAEIFRNYDHAFSRDLAASRTRRVIDARATVAIADGSIALTLEDADGNISTVSHKEAFEPANNPEKALETIRAQVSKSGDTIFRVVAVDITAAPGCAIPFVPASAVNSLRRQGLEELLEKRKSATPPRYPAQPDNSYPYPSPILRGEDNVTNSLAERFYRRHGVKEISPGLDLADDFGGKCVMRTPYCIRRETGECLREKPRLTGPLWLDHGRHRYRLEFDCERCEMLLINDNRE